MRRLPSGTRPDHDGRAPASLCDQRLEVLLWPPTRRRLHRFINRKLDRPHAKVDALAVRHDEHTPKASPSGISRSNSLTKEK